MNYNKLADNIISKLNLNDASFSSIKGFSHSLNFFIEVVELDFKSIFYIFDADKNKSFENQSELRLTLVYYFIFMYIYRYKKLHMRMGKVWIKVKTKAYIKRYTHWDIWELLKEYMNGKQSGKYKSVNSFKKQLREFNIDPEDFKKIVQIYGTYKSRVRAKFNKF